MSVNTTHLEYDAHVATWLRARDVLAGEDAVKAGGEKYLPRLDAQSEEEYAAYQARAAFFNATARTADGYLGQVFRRAPFVKIPEGGGAIGQALEAFVNDADMLGTSLASYAKNVVKEIVAVGRAGTLIDWEGENEDRAYASLYAAESILNWRTERLNGRNLLSLVVLHETVRLADAHKKPDDEFETRLGEQIRVLKLVDSGELMVDSPTSEHSASSIHHPLACVVEVWQRVVKGGAALTPGVSEPRREAEEWVMVERRIPLRVGETAAAIELRQSGENSVLGSLATSLSTSLSHLLRWSYSTGGIQPSRGPMM